MEISIIYPWKLPTAVLPRKTRGKVVSVRRCKSPQNDEEFIVVSANDKARKNASFCEQS